MLSLQPLLRPWRALLVFVFLVTAALPLHAAEKPIVTTSIHPLALLVAEVAGDEVELHTLISAGQSPHTYQMRPSDRRLLADSDIIFWVGPTMELFLQGLMSQEDLREKSLALAPAILPEHFGMEDSPGGEQSGAEGHGHGHDHEQAQERTGEHHPEGHDHGGEDPHIWLEPGLAKRLALTIAEALKATGKMDNGLIDKNLADFEARLAKTDQDIQARLDGLRGVSLYTYHEAFGLFAEHYGLKVEGSLTFSPEVQPGARHLSEVQARLRQAENPCVLTEPQFTRQWWKSITSGIDLTISQWDPLASGIEPRQGSYTLFLEGLAEAVMTCQKAE